MKCRSGRKDLLDIQGIKEIGNGKKFVIGSSVRMLRRVLYGRLGVNQESRMELKK